MNKVKEIRCPSKDCPDKFHPYGTIHCPKTGELIKKPFGLKFNKALKESKFLSLNNIIYALSIIVTLYSLFCTIYSDIIIQNNNNVILWPFDFLSNRELSFDFNKFLYNQPSEYNNPGKVPESEVEDKKIYIFVLDCSGSVQAKNTSDFLRYKDEIEYLCNNIPFKCPYNEKSKLSMQDVAKIRICNTLLKLCNEKRRKIKTSADEFGIWTVEDESTMIYPPKTCRTSLNHDNVMCALNAVLTTNISGKNTDFSSLFRKITNQYEEFQKMGDGPFGNPEITLIIFSDLQHDVANKYQQQKQIEENWDHLVKKIQEISYANVMANIIILSEGEPDIQKTIFPIFKKNNIYWFRLNKYAINSNESYDLVYTAISSKENIKFYYVNSFRIDKTSFIFNSLGKNAIKIDIPIEMENSSPSNFALYCEHIGASGRVPEDLKESRMLLVGGPSLEIKPDLEDKLKLSYSGRLPSNSITPLLRLSISGDNKAFLIPIDFIKRLPVWAAVIMSFLYILFLGYILILLWRGCQFFREKYAGARGKPGYNQQAQVNQLNSN
ncbi:MAG TPA: hypothetical protein VK186_28355 [Candidatus Deferrimicrobium sp.]|nr:hypothetical protein [Candidatus Deferrimicrobium sp.]